MIYAIGDIHGRLDLLEAAFDAIDDIDDNPTIITVGDYIDRGHDSADCIRFLMREQGSRNLICLKGNHEEWLVSVCRSGWNVKEWLDNGGVQTLVSYGHSPSGPVDLSVVPEHHIAWMDNLPLFHVTEHHVFVHAFMDPTLPIEKQSSNSMLWARYPEGLYEGKTDWSVEGRHIVHGHTPHEKPVLLESRTNIDVGAVFTSRCLIAVFDRPGKPEKLIWV